MLRNRQHLAPIVQRLRQMNRASFSFRDLLGLKQVDGLATGLAQIGAVDLVDDKRQSRSFAWATAAVSQPGFTRNRRFAFCTSGLIPATNVS